MSIHVDMHSRKAPAVQITVYPPDDQHIAPWCVLKLMNDGEMREEVNIFFPNLETIMQLGLNIEAAYADAWEAVSNAQAASVRQRIARA